MEAFGFSRRARAACRASVVRLGHMGELVSVTVRGVEALIASTSLSEPFTITNVSLRQKVNDMLHRPDWCGPLTWTAPPRLSISRTLTRLVFCRRHNIQEWGLAWSAPSSRSPSQSFRSEPTPEDSNPGWTRGRSRDQLTEAQLDASISNLQSFFFFFNKLWFRLEQHSLL